MKILNSLKQAERFIKYANKKLSYYNNDGCGCCYSGSSYRIDGNRIIYSVSGEIQGSFFAKAEVVGKIKIHKQQTTGKQYLKH